MIQTNKKTLGLESLLRRVCTVIESKTRSGRPYADKKSGKIIINSLQLKDRIGEKVIVLVYGKRGSSCLRKKK